MVRTVTEPIDPAQCYSLLGKEASGSVLLHFAVVKSDGGTGRETTRIEYRAAGDVTAELEEIAHALQETWKLEDVLLIRRVGTLAVGEIISLVAVSSPGSEEALAACRDGIARLKKMATIAKKEVFGG